MRHAPRSLRWNDARLAVASAGGLALAIAGLASAPLAIGCGDYAAGGDPTDGGADWIDAGFAADDGGPGADGAAPLADNEDRAGNAAGCFDFVDSDGDMLVDCDDFEDCGAHPICCVDRATEACCVDELAATTDFSTCTGTGSAALAACVAGATLFGSPGPELRGGTLIPNGGARFDSGLALGVATDPRVERLAVSARIAAGEACAGCIDAVAIGLTSSQETLGPTTLVDPDVGVVVSTSAGEVRLLVGGAIAGSVGLEDLRGQLGLGAAGAPIVYELRTEPSGTASLTARAPDAPLESAHTLFSGVRFLPRGPARVVAWGRSANPGPGDPPPARIETLDVTTELCDTPGSAAAGSAPILPDDVDTWWDRDERVGGASVVQYVDADGMPRSLMVFSYQGRIHLAGPIADGRFRALADPRIPANALLAGDGASWSALGLFEPELARVDGHWELWFTAIGADGSPSIGRARSGAGWTVQVGAAEQVLAPDAGAGTFGWDGPSFLEVSLGGGAPRRFLAARRRAATRTEIVLRELMEDGALDAAEATRYDASEGGVTTSDVVRAPTGIPTTFDADEVAAPSLVHHRGVLRLYYAGRRGTRWAIGVMVSEDGRYWREANGGAPVIAGSGAGFDALGVTEPEPVIEGGELRLYYTGSDGIGGAIGLARHRVADGSTP